MVVEILFYLPGIVLLVSSIAKLAKTHSSTAEFTQFNLLKYRYFAASVELLAAVLLIIPQARMLGSLLASSYLGGVIVCCWQFLSFKRSIPAIVLSIMIWIGSVLYLLPFATN